MQRVGAGMWHDLDSLPGVDIAMRVALIGDGYYDAGKSLFLGRLVDYNFNFSGADLHSQFGPECRSKTMEVDEVMLFNKLYHSKQSTNGNGILNVYQR